MFTLKIKDSIFLLFIISFLNPLKVTFANKTDVFNLQTAQDLPPLASMGFQNQAAFTENFDIDWIEKNLKKNSSWRIATWMQNRVLMRKENLHIGQNPEQSINESFETDNRQYNENYSTALIQKVVPYDNNVPINIAHSGSSIQTKNEFGYGRWLAKVKPSNVPGVLNSIFIKDVDNKNTTKPKDGSKREVDIEFLTRTFGKKSGQIHLAIHGNPKLGEKKIYAVDINLNFNPSDDYHIWGFDILPDKVVWHVDGKVLHTWRYLEFFYINEGYEFFINSWTHKRWIHGPPGSVAEYKIDWVKFYPLINSQFATKR